MTSERLPAGAMRSPVDGPYAWFRLAVCVVLGTVGSIGGRWRSTGELAKDRNALDAEGSQRGWGWRVKMMFKGKTKYQRSKAKTAAQKTSTDGIACRVGKLYLLAEPTASEIETFIDQLQLLPDSQILTASADPDNELEWRELLVELLQSRMPKKTPVGAGA